MDTTASDQLALTVHAAVTAGWPDDRQPPETLQGHLLDGVVAAWHWHDDHLIVWPTGAGGHVVEVVCADEADTAQVVDAVTSSIPAASVIETGVREAQGRSAHTASIQLPEEAS